jgi:hypothetical protein
LAKKAAAMDVTAEHTMTDDAITKQFVSEDIMTEYITVEDNILECGNTAATGRAEV